MYLTVPVIYFVVKNSKPCLYLSYNGKLLKRAPPQGTWEVSISLQCSITQRKAKQTYGNVSIPRHRFLLAFQVSTLPPPHLPASLQTVKPRFSQSPQKTHLHPPSASYHHSKFAKSSNGSNFTSKIWTTFPVNTLLFLHFSALSLNRKPPDHPVRVNY